MLCKTEKAISLLRYDINYLGLYSIIITITTMTVILLQKSVIMDTSVTVGRLFIAMFNVL